MVWLNGLLIQKLPVSSPDDFAMTKPNIETMKHGTTRNTHFILYPSKH